MTGGTGTWEGEGRGNREGEQGGSGAGRERRATERERKSRPPRGHGHLKSAPMIGRSNHYVTNPESTGDNNKSLKYSSVNLGDGNQMTVERQTRTRIVVPPTPNTNERQNYTGTAGGHRKTPDSAPTGLRKMSSAAAAIDGQIRLLIGR